MKIKYNFSEINSNADTIKVTSGTEDLITLSKSDFGNDWSNALNNDYYIADYQCNNLANLKISGAEDHTAVYTDELNSKWKEFTQNKIGDKHFTDSLVTDTLDSTKPVKIYNQTAFTSTKDVRTLIYNAYLKLGSTYSYDFSSLDVSCFDSTSSNINYLLPNYIDGNNYQYPVCLGVHSYTSSSDYVKNSWISKWFELPEGITNLNYAFYKTGITELPKIPSTVTDLDYTFMYCSSLTKIDDLDLPNVKTAILTFYSCSALETVGNLNFPAVSFLTLFENSSKLTKIGNVVSGGSVSLVSSCSNKDSLQEIGNIICKGGVTIGGNSTTYAGKKLLKVGDITNIGETCSGLSLQDMAEGGSVGNITNLNDIYLLTSNISIGIVNCSIVNSNNLFNTLMPMKCVAIPNYLLWLLKSRHAYSNTSYLPTSTGSDIWMDYYNGPTNEFIHNITNPSYTISEAKETLNTSETVHIKNFNVLEKNASYDHTFEVTSCNVNTTQTSSDYTSVTGTNVDTSNITFTLNSDGTADITIPCTNIKDDSVSSGTIVKSIEYVANIDGNEFHGATKVTIDFSYTWQINESVVANTTLLDDDGNVINTTEESSLEESPDTSSSTEESVDSSDSTEESSSEESTPTE